MLSDFELICHKFADRPDIHIYPVGDVHLGAAEHMAHEWQEFCKTILADEHGYVVLLGDLINNATRSSVSNIFEETMRPRDQKRLMVEMLRPLKPRILAMVSGNHERRSGKDADDDPSYDIASKLDIEDLYRRDNAFLKIQMGDNRNAGGDRNPTYILTITHGAAGGRLTGNAVNRAEQFGYILSGSDALILGHSHKPFVTQPSQIIIDPRQNQVYMRPFKVVSCTSWLRYGGYAMQKQLLPSSNAPQIMTLCGRKKQILVQM